MYATVAFCHQRICKADIAPVDVSQARRERGIKTVAVSAGYITLLVIPIIAVTSYALSGEGQKERVAGWDDYVPKPFSPRQLLAKVYQYLT